MNDGLLHIILGSGSFLSFLLALYVLLDKKHQASDDLIKQVAVLEERIHNQNELLTKLDTKLNDLMKELLK